MSDKTIEAMQNVYNCLLDPNNTRLEEALESSLEIMRPDTESRMQLLEQGADDADREELMQDHQQVVEHASNFLGRFRFFFKMFKVDPVFIGADPALHPRSPREILNEFRTKYNGKTMEEACKGQNGEENPRRRAALQKFALSSATKSYLGVWRRARVGNVGSDTATSGEEPQTIDALFRDVLKRIHPTAGAIVANHVDRSGIMMMPSEETESPEKLPAAASSQASDGKQEKLEGSDGKQVKPESSEGNQENPEASEGKQVKPEASSKKRKLGNEN